MEMEVLAIVMVFSLFALILGGIPVPFALAVSGLVFGVVRLGWRVSLNRPYAFGPWLTVGAWAAWWWTPSLVAWLAH